jgi:hypothetical protein
MSSGNDGFETGRRGGSVFSTKDTLGWAAGDLARKNEEAFNSALSGEEHANAWQIFILVGAVGAVMGLLLDRGLVPSFLTVAGWRVVAAWLGSAAAIYFGLKAIPGWLSGTIMGVLLGGAAGYAGWIYLSPSWAAGLGLGVGALMYLFFSSLE